MDLLIRLDHADSSSGDNLYRQLKALGHGSELTQWLHQKLSASASQSNLDHIASDLRLLSIGVNGGEKRKRKKGKKPISPRKRRLQTLTVKQLEQEKQKRLKIVMVNKMEEFISNMWAERRKYEQGQVRVAFWARRATYVMGTPKYTAKQVVEYIVPVIGAMLRARVRGGTSLVLSGKNPALIAAQLMQWIVPPVVEDHKNVKTRQALGKALKSPLGQSRIESGPKKELASIDKLFGAVLSFNNKLTYVMPNIKRSHIHDLAVALAGENAFSDLAYVFLVYIITKSYPSLSRQTGNTWIYAMAFVLYAEIESQLFKRMGSSNYLLSRTRFELRQKTLLGALRKGSSTKPLAKQLADFQTSADILLGEAVVNTYTLIPEITSFLNRENLKNTLQIRCTYSIIQQAAETLKNNGWGFENPLLFLRQPQPTHHALFLRTQANAPRIQSTLSKLRSKLRSNREKQEEALRLLKRSLGGRIGGASNALRILRGEEKKLIALIRQEAAAAAKAKAKPAAPPTARRSLSLQNLRKLVWRLATALVHTARAGTRWIKYAALTPTYLRRLGMDNRILFRPFVVMRGPEAEEVHLSNWQKAMVAYVATYLMVTPLGISLDTDASPGNAMFSVFVTGAARDHARRLKEEGADTPRRRMHPMFARKVPQQRFVIPAPETITMVTTSTSTTTTTNKGDYLSYEEILEDEDADPYSVDDWYGTDEEDDDEATVEDCDVCGEEKCKCGDDDDDDDVDPMWVDAGI